MFMIKSLLGTIWSDPNNNELAKIPTGELHITRPRSGTKGPRECLYNEAMATVRRTGAEFQYQLVITKVYEEGEEELLDEDDETDEERTFLIDQSLEFRESSYDGSPALVWRDMEGDDEDLFEFVAKGSNKATAALFTMAVLRAMYERRSKRSSEGVKDAELKQLLYKPSPSASSARSRPGPSVLPQHAHPATSSSPVIEEPNSSLSQESEQVLRPPKPVLGDTRTADHGPALISEVGELLWFDFAEDGFLVQADSVDVQIKRGVKGPFNYWLVASEPENTWLCHELTSELNCKWSATNLAFRWNHHSTTGDFGAWCVRFADRPAYERMREAVGRCLYEHANQISWEQAAAEETSYAREAYVDQDVEMQDAYGDEEDDEEAVVDELASEDEDDRSADDDEDDEFHGAEQTTRERNSQLAVGFKNDRTFVVRGNRIGVFKNTDDDKVEYAATINKVNTPKGKEFTPKKIMLHDADTSMILMNPSHPNSLFRMDLEYGKVVDEWKVHDDVEISHMAPKSKFAQTTGEQTFVGASHNGVFRVDPRISGNKLVDGDFKQYKTKAAFSNIATTGSGGLAVSSEKGDIRLFDKIGKNAKTALPALGDPIIGVDTTANGRYVVATCKTHLYLIDTLIGEGRFQGQLGFDRSFPANARPIPKRLQLKPEHVAYMGGEISFTPARFNMGPNEEEHTIVTSTGKYVVAWDFKKIKQGKLDKYEIKQYEDDVVADNFRFAHDKDIIVALSDNVLMLNKKTLKRPTRASLANPTLLAPSRSNIVNSPY